MKKINFLSSKQLNGVKIMQTLPKIEETLIAVIKTLPTEKQQALLEFAEFLQAKTIPKATSKSIKAPIQG